MRSAFLAPPRMRSAFGAVRTHMRHASFFSRLRSWTHGRSYVGTDERGNEYYVEAAAPRSATTTSIIKEKRGVDLANSECACCMSLRCATSALLHLICLFDSPLPDDPDAIPVPWRLWLAGTQLLPPNVAAVSGANSTLHRIGALPEEERFPHVDGHRAHTDTPPDPLQSDASGRIARNRIADQFGFQPESWDGGSSRSSSVHFMPLQMVGKQAKAEANSANSPISAADPWAEADKQSEGRKAYEGRTETRTEGEGEASVDGESTAAADPWVEADQRQAGSGSSSWVGNVKKTDVG